MNKLMWLYAAGIAPMKKAPETNDGSGKETSPWDELFAGQTPEQVKRALDDSRKWEQRAKANLDAVTERDALKAAADQSKSETEKLTERLAALEAENQSARAEKQVQAWAKEIVKGSKVPADALRGSTEEELRAHFEQLKTLIGAGAPAGEPAGGEQKKPAATAPYVPGEGKTPTGGDAQQSVSRPGVGTLREAYAESAESK